MTKPKAMGSDTMLKEIVRVRCHKNHETFALIDPATSSRMATLLPPWTCQHPTPGVGQGRCCMPLVIVAGRGIAFRTVTIGAEWFNVKAPRPEEHAGQANAQRYQTRKDRFRGAR